MKVLLFHIRKLTQELLRIIFSWLLAVRLAKLLQFNRKLSSKFIVKHKRYGLVSVTASVENTDKADGCQNIAPSDSMNLRQNFHCSLMQIEIRANRLRKS